MTRETVSYFIVIVLRDIEIRRTVEGLGREGPSVTTERPLRTKGGVGSIRPGPPPPFPTGRTRSNGEGLTRGRRKRFRR